MEGCLADESFFKQVDGCLALRLFDCLSSYLIVHRALLALWLECICLIPELGAVADSASAHVRAWKGGRGVSEAGEAGSYRSDIERE